MRLVALGASNLRRELPALVATFEAATRGAADEPPEVLAACGHGRSYGAWSAILGGLRALPGIVDCGLWRALAVRPPRPTLALLTDVGNDLAYGYEADRIATWVASCLARLADAGATTVLTLPPRESLSALPEWQFHAARRIFFPFRAVDRGVIERRLEELESRLLELARDVGAAVVECPAAWHGLDPIHRHRAGRCALRRKLLERWSLDDGANAADARLPPLTRLRLAVARPERVRWLGVELGRPQPALRLDGGGSVGLY